MADAGDGGFSEAEAKRTGTQGRSWLHSELKPSLSSLDPDSKKPNVLAERGRNHGSSSNCPTKLYNSAGEHTPEFNMDPKKPTSPLVRRTPPIPALYFWRSAATKAVWAAPRNLDLTEKTSQSEPKTTSKCLQVSENTHTFGGHCPCAGR